MAPVSDPPTWFSLHGQWAVAAVVATKIGIVERWSDCPLRLPGPESSSVEDDSAAWAWLLSLGEVEVVAEAKESWTWSAWGEMHQWYSVND